MIALAAAIALPTAALTTWVVLRTPLATALVARPRGDRWHARETPLVGGIGVFAGLLAGCGLAAPLVSVHPASEIVAILAGAGLLFAVGIVDDAFSLPPLVKLAAQVGAAVIAVTHGLTVELVKT